MLGLDACENSKGTANILVTSSFRMSPDEYSIQLYDVTSWLSKAWESKAGRDFIPIRGAMFPFGLVRKYLVQIHSFDPDIIPTLDGIESACLHLRVEFLFGDDTVQLFLG